MRDESAIDIFVTSVLTNTTHRSLAFLHLALSSCVLVLPLKRKSLHQWVCFKWSILSTHAHTHTQFLPFETLSVSLSPAILLAVITRLVDAMLDREQDSPAVLHSWAFGATLSSYTVYVVANTDAFHETVAKELFPLYTTPDGGQGAGRGESGVSWNVWKLDFKSYDLKWATAGLFLSRQPVTDSRYFGFS